jgi:cell division protein FtsB
VKSLLKNRYFLVIIGFLTWLVFFDDDDLPKQIRLSMELQDRKEQVNYLRNQIDSLKTDKKMLFEDPHSREKFAREKYLMKRDNEDLFIITPPISED